MMILTFIVHWTFLAASPALLLLSEFPSGAPDDSSSLLSLQGEAVQVRGFWYPFPPDGGVLAASPQVKSCCLKAPSKIYQQLFVEGNLPSAVPQRAVTLEGIFKIKPLYNTEGEAVQYYVLEEAKEIGGPASLSMVWMISGVAGISLVFLIIKKYMLR